MATGDGDELVDAVGRQPVARAAFAGAQGSAVALQAVEDSFGLAASEPWRGVELRVDSRLRALKPFDAQLMTVVHKLPRRLQYERPESHYDC